MESQELLQLVTQIPIVALFAWFVLKRDKDYQLASEKRDKSMQDFMTDIHTRNKECIEGISESLDKMKTQVARNTTAIVMHDATVRGEGTAHFGTTQDVLDKVLNNGKS